jgi:hypothetical protein
MNKLPIAALLLLAACVSKPEASFSPPEASGLEGGRNYPGDEDVCQVIGENSLTQEYLDDSATLIGCPRAEAGAIADRKAEGATVLTEVGEWVLLSVPGI